MSNTPHCTPAVDPADFTFETIELPSSQGFINLAEDVKINDQGEIAGYALYAWPTPTTTKGVEYTQFKDDHGLLTTELLLGSVYNRPDPTPIFDAIFPQWVASSNSVTTQMLFGSNSNSASIASVNDNGQAVGRYRGADGLYHAYLYSEGQITSIDMPGAGSTTDPTDIADSGEIVGYYFDASNVTHGFILWHGRFHTFDVPGAVSTRIDGINNEGQIVGTFSDESSDSQAFVATTQPWLRETMLSLPADYQPFTGTLSTAASVNHYTLATANQQTSYYFQLLSTDLAQPVSITVTDPWGRVVGSAQLQAGSIGTLTLPETSGNYALNISDAGETGSYTLVDGSGIVEQTDISGSQLSSSVRLMSDYTGPMNLKDQYLLNTSDTVAITDPSSANAFIYVGADSDAMASITCNGISDVLASDRTTWFTNSTIGFDTDYVDHRALLGNVWDTVANFGLDNEFTVWGVTPRDFTLQLLGGNNGASGATGPTYVFTPKDSSYGPSVGVTFAGLTADDLPYLSIDWGMIGGTPFATIERNIFPDAGQNSPPDNLLIATQLTQMYGYPGVTG